MFFRVVCKSSSFSPQWLFKYPPTPPYLLLTISIVAIITSFLLPTILSTPSLSLLIASICINLSTIPSLISTSPISLNAYSSAISSSDAPTNKRISAQSTPVLSFPAEQCTRHFSSDGWSLRKVKTSLKACPPDERISS
ncbi:hypothetical protein ABVK25_010270 [Lepraria finkii]|uniref:Uncharacterized protein n=1 Tax=Lepraria finkii TaxID=1340010 RepID=A0ABR4AUW3_9LECA